MQKNILQFLFSGNLSAKGIIKNAARHSVAERPFASILELQNSSQQTRFSFENANFHLFSGLNALVDRMNPGGTKTVPLKIIDFTFDPTASDFETANTNDLGQNFVPENADRIFAAFLNKGGKNHSFQNYGQDREGEHVIPLKKAKAAKEDQNQVCQKQIAVVVPDADIKLLFANNTKHVDSPAASSRNVSAQKHSGPKSVNPKTFAQDIVNKRTFGERPETTAGFPRGENNSRTVSNAKNIVKGRAISDPVKSGVSNAKDEYSQTKENVKAAESVIPNKRTFSERPETTVLFSRDKGKVSSVSTANNIVADRAISNPVKAGVSDAKAEYSQTKENVKVAESVIPNKSTSGERPETTVLFTRGEGKVSSVSTANNIVGDRAISNPVKAKVSDTKSEHSQTKEKAKAAGTVIPNKKTFGERPETTALFSRGKEKVSGVSTAKNIVEDRAVSDRVKAGVSDAKAEHSQTKEHVGTSANFHAVEKDQVSAKAAESVIPNKRTFHVKPVTIENKAMREKPTVQANPVDRVKTFVPQGNSDGNVIQTHERTSHAILKAHLQGVIRRRWALNNTANSLNGISAATKNSSNALVDASNPASHYSQQSMQSKKDGSQNPGTLLDKTILARFGKHADSAQPSISLFDGFGAGQKITANPVNSIMQNTSTPATVSVLSYWIADGAKLMISRKESFLSVKAESDELGKLVIQMGHENKKFGITIHVQSEQSKMLLENSLPELKQQLAQKDMLLSDIRILINDKPERRFSGGSRSNDKKWQESRKRKTDSKVSQLNDKMAMDIRRIESRWSTYHAVA